MEVMLAEEEFQNLDGTSKEFYANIAGMNYRSKQIACLVLVKARRRGVNVLFEVLPRARRLFHKILSACLGCRFWGGGVVARGCNDADCTA